jgi:hypothetical chaperone protein
VKLGVDFGTSFSSAAVFIDGEIQPIKFGHEHQLRTAAFFPDRYVDLSQFYLTAEYEHEIDNAIRAQNSLYSELSSLYEKSLGELIWEEKRKAKDGTPLNAEQKAKRRELLIKPKRQSPDAARQSQINAIRRRWVSEQRESIAQERLDVRKANGVFGEEAIDALYNDEPGRIFQSPKSMLGFSLEPALQDTVVAVIAQVLAHIRAVAGQQLGADLNAVVLGRPVEFRGTVGSTNDQAVQDLLERAAIEAGFSSVEFLTEPCAAALGFHRQCSESIPALIIDIGGGTTDIAFAQVGGDGSQPVIHKVWGCGRGGTDVDVELSVRTAMPLFGKDHQFGLPLHAYRSAAKISDLNLQRAFARQSTSGVIEPFKTRLERLKEKGTTVRLNRDVEQLKINLSDERFSCVALEYIGDDITVYADQGHLEASAQSFMAYFRGLLEQVRTELPEPAPVVFMTGGMSRATYVKACVREIFGQSEIVMGNASLGVVAGLAYFAAPKLKAGQLSPMDTQRMLRQRELFQSAMVYADKIAATYEKQNASFQRQYEMQKKIFARTRICTYLRVLNDTVCNAYELNADAGWLPSGAQFTELEYFETLIKQDRSARHYKSLSNIPLFLLKEFEEFEPEDFQAYAQALRETSRYAGEEMSNLREIMDDEPAEEDFFDALDAWPEEAGAPEREITEGRALFDNLQAGWLDCQKTGLGLLHMANYMGNEDYDSSLMDELLDS